MDFSMSNLKNNIKDPSKLKDAYNMMPGDEQEQEPMLDVSHPASRMEWQPLGQMPSYDKGGDVTKDQIAQVHQDERVLNPDESHAYRAAEQGNAPPTLLGSIANRAQELYSQGKVLSAPEDEEARSFVDKQKMINQYQEAAKPSTVKAEMPMMAPAKDPSAAYGTRSGEQRLDAEGNMINPRTPEGMSATGPKMSVPPALLGRIPSYDDGGDVPEDQTAELHKDEHVLDPEKAEAYRQAESEVMNNVPLGHGTIAQRKDVRQYQEPKLDTDSASPTDKVQGAEMKKIPNAPLGNPVMNKDNPPTTFENPMVGEASTKTASLPYSPSKMNYPSIETPQRSGATDHPQTGDEGLPVIGEKREDETKIAAPVLSPEMKVVKQDQMDAMKSGDLVKLGMANINARMLRADEGKGAQVPLPEPTAPTPEENLQNQRAELRHKMVNGQTEQERFQAEKDLAELNRKNPWGSEANHPGLLGKIGHVAAGLGQAATMGVAPYLLPAIPGSQAQLQQQAARGEQGVEEAQKKEATEAETGLKNAQTTAALNKPPVSDKYEVKDVQDTRKQLPDGTPNPNFGKTVVAGVNKSDPTDVQFTGQVASPKTDKPETHEQFENEYADLKRKQAAGETLSPDEQKKFQTLQTQLSVGDDNAKQYNGRIADLGIPENLKPHYTVLPTDTDAEAKQKEAAAQSLEAKGTAKTDKDREQAGKVYDKYNTQLDKLATPITAAATRSNLLVHNLDAKTKQGDALVAPELLSIAAGGAGSGLRMNEAEISRVIGGRSVWDALVAKANQIKEKGGTFDDTQRSQLRSISEYINDRNAAQVYLINKGREAMLSHQTSESGVRSSYEKISKAVSEVASKGIAPAKSKVSDGDYVFHNGDVLKVSIGKDGKPTGTPVEF